MPFPVGSTLFCIGFFLTLSHPRRVTLSMSSGCFALCAGNPSPLNMTPFYYFLNAKNRANELCQDVSIPKSNSSCCLGCSRFGPVTFLHQLFYFVTLYREPLVSWLAVFVEDNSFVSHVKIILLCIII